MLEFAVDDVDFSSMLRNLSNDFKIYQGSFIFLMRAEAERVIPIMMRKIFRSSPTYKALVQGKLEAEFGLSTPELTVEGVINSIVKASQFHVREEDDSYVLEIGVFRSDFTDALSSIHATYLSINKSGNTTLIPWLEWLLFDSTDIVVFTHEIKYRNSRQSRSGKALMIRRKKASRRNGAPSHWHVPAEFAGTHSKNWLTEVGDLLAPKVQEWLTKYLDSKI